MTKADIEQLIRDVGLKVTAPRVLVYEQLAKAEVHHMSAETIYTTLSGKGQDIGLATVYRVLNQFEEAGLISKHHFDGDHAIYELAHKEHHDHMVCTVCGAVQEFCDPLIEKQILAVASASQFKCEGHQFTLYGRCSRCRSS